MQQPAPRVRISTVALVAGVLLGALIGPTIGMARDRPAPARHLRTPEHVTSGTQAELTARMGRHSESMSNLMRAVVLIDRPAIRLFAGRIADEEVIARTSRSVHEPLPLSLPREFFLEQTKLVVAARDLGAAAAEGSDDRVLADRFASLTGTCVACHSAYLHGEPDNGPWGVNRDARDGER